MQRQIEELQSRIANASSAQSTGGPGHPNPPAPPTLAPMGRSTGGPGHPIPPAPHTLAQTGQDAGGPGYPMPPTPPTAVTTMAQRQPQPQQQPPPPPPEAPPRKSRPPRRCLRRAPSGVSNSMVTIDVMSQCQDSHDLSKRMQNLQTTLFEGGQTSFMKLRLRTDEELKCGRVEVHFGTAQANRFVLLRCTASKSQVAAAHVTWRAHRTEYPSIRRSLLARFENPSVVDEHDLANRLREV